MQKQQLFEQVQVLYDGSPSFEGLSSGIETSLLGSDCVNTPSPAKRPTTSFSSPVVKRQKKEPSLEELQREALLGQIAINNKFSSVLDQVAATLCAISAHSTRKERKGV
uniref:Uncharacterized protein n=1 Tax=Ditylenchus dipsaci TaxID=166011 RepID=A0A915E247_9BILA